MKIRDLLKRWPGNLARAASVTTGDGPRAVPESRLMTPPVAAMPMPLPSVAPETAAGGRAVAALVLGILGLVTFGLLAPVAWILGHLELAAIGRHDASAAGEGVARVGMILGIVGTVLFVLPVLVVLGLAALAVVVAGIVFLGAAATGALGLLIG